VPDIRVGENAEARGKSGKDVESAMVFSRSADAYARRVSPSPAEFDGGVEDFAPHNGSRESAGANDEVKRAVR
jgi:hypothetical protein